MSQHGLRFTLKIDGLPEMTTAVVGFSLYQRHSTPFVLDVDIASGLPDLVATDFLEKNAVLTIWQGAVAQRYVSGIVNEVSSGENNHWQMCYHLTIVPPLWRCGLRQNFRIFQQQDIRTISSTLLTENGVTAWTPVFYEPHPAREFCVQYGETDLDFLTRLWAEEGIFYFDWTPPEGPEQKLVLCDDVAGVSTLGEIPFNPNAATEVSTACISSFRYRARTGPSSVETQDYTFKTPAWPGWYSRAAENLNGQRTQYEIFDYPGRFKDEYHGQAFARYQIEGWRHDTETATCISNSPVLRPGKRFRLTGHPSDTLNREWQVVNSVLTGNQPQALHGSEGQGTTLENQFGAIPADRTWRMQPPAKPAVDGPQSALVTGPAGEEIFCDEHGRVRVRFHWDRYCPGNEDSSCWVRVSQAWAGAGFGNLAIPRVGQEVIVDFLNGDPDQPIIMGRTYHQDNRSPGSLPGTKTQMTIRSKTYKGSGFNELRFEDATGNEQVYIHAQKNMDTEVLHDRTTTVNNNHTETVVVGQTVKVGSKKEGGHDQKTTVANDRRITVGNDQTLKVKNDRTVNISHDDGLYVTNDRRVTVKGKQEHSTTGNHISLVEGKHSLEVKGDLARKVAGALGIKVEGDIVLESSGSISLKAGGSFIVIQAGGVDIVGPEINLNGGGSPGTPVGILQPGVPQGLFDEQFRVLGDKGKPMVNVPYFICSEDGQIFKGFTDVQGLCKRVFTNESAKLTVWLGIDALEKW
ncbi:type VI secretion system tip protein VgrG [Citrobacter amalonaticus]|uniref:type VI secretion system tip protein TssI/VgrG n=1 Tax=Citrobacter amalonaticus TaxID=35703 RepID=UPI0019077145|nr:type VI secretion system tip protein TssI/VgrG [Citrobacter amalonaticus]MBJ9329508.1 type VI secretion system tip protein VgrG [Citrobacter amalonaticus]